MKLADAKRRYEAALEQVKAKIARVFAERWNRQRFAEQMERRRQATQQGTQGTPQTQPGGTTPGSGAGGNIGQTQTLPTVAQVPKINVIEDIAGGGEGYNTSGFALGWSATYAKSGWSVQGAFEYTQPLDDYSGGGADYSSGGVDGGQVEYVKVCTLYGAGFFYIPGTDTCLKIGSYVGFIRTDINNHLNFEFQTSPGQNKFIRLRSYESLVLPLIGTEKNTETGSQDGPLQCVPSNGSCVIPVTPAQGSAYVFPDVVGNLNLNVAWGNVPAGNSDWFRVQYVDYQYGGSIADITGQPPQAPVQVPQGFQANAYDYAIGQYLLRRFGFRCTHGRPLVQFVNILQMAYSRIEDDPGRSKEPALDPDPASASGLSEKLPQAQLDLRPPSTRTRARR